MSTLLHYLPFGIAVVLAGAACFICFRLGRRWKQEYSNAKDYRAHLEGEAQAAAMMRAQLTQNVQANPTINVNNAPTLERAGVYPELHNQRRGAQPSLSAWTLCPVCARSDCRLDCVEEIENGRTPSVFRGSVVNRDSGPERLVADDFGAIAWPFATRERLHNDQQQELDDEGMFSDQ